MELCPSRRHQRDPVPVFRGTSIGKRLCARGSAPAERLFPAGRLFAEGACRFSLLLSALLEVLPLTQPEHLGLEGGAVAADSGRCFSPCCDARASSDRTLSSKAVQMNFPNKVVKPAKSCVAVSTANLNGLHLIWLK